MKKLILLALICASFSLQAQTYKTVTMYLDTIPNIAILRAGTQSLNLNNTYAQIQDGLLSGGVATIGAGSVSIATANYRIAKVNYTSVARTFTGIANSPAGTQYYLVVYGKNNSTLDTISGARANIAVIPNNPISTQKINTILVGSGGVVSSQPDLSGYAKLNVNNVFTTDQIINGNIRSGEVTAFNQDANSAYIGTNFSRGASTYLKTGNYANQLHFDSSLGELTYKLGAVGISGNTITFDTPFIIKASGNIGIKKLVPLYPLDVGGDINISAGSTYRVNGIAIGTGSGTVTNISATNGTGQTFTITNPTTTPNISLALTQSAVGLGNVDNTSDVNKPISTATQTALDTKLTKSGDIITGDIGNTSTGFFRIPSGTTAQRPVTPLDGMRRYNTTTLRDEFYANSLWQNHARLTGDVFTGNVEAPSFISSGNTTVGGNLAVTGTTTLTSNIGIGYTPPLGTTGVIRQIFVGNASTNGGVFWGQTNATSLGLLSASYFNNSNVAIYSSSVDRPSQLRLFNGQLRFSNAVTGTIGNTVTFNHNIFSVEANGNTLINTVTDNGNDKLQVTGSGIFSTNLQGANLGAGITPSASTRLLLAPATVSISSFRMPNGVAPTTPVTGDWWSLPTGTRTQTFDGVQTKDVLFDKANAVFADGIVGVALIDGAGNIAKGVQADRTTSNTQTKTASYTVVLSDFGANGTLFIRADATAGDMVITLPAASVTAGLTVIVKKVDATTNVVTISAASIDGLASRVIRVANVSSSIISNGTVYNITAIASLVPFQLRDFYTDAINTSITETDLYTYTTLANRLSSDGEKLTASFTGLFSDATASSQLRVFFAGTQIGDTGALTMSVTGSFNVNVTIIRTGATTARASVNVSTPGASTASYTNYTSLTGLNFTTTNIIKLTGQAGSVGGGTGDITATMGNIVFQPSAL